MIHQMSRPAFAYINLDHLCHNYHRLQQMVSGKAEIMAVVKSNAYGHGLEIIAPSLFQQGCRNFAVTDTGEGSQLRGFFDPEELAVITLLAGVFDREDAMLAVAHHLTPAITESGQVELLQAAGFHDAVWIKVDTGMGRLDAANPAALIQQCTKAGIRICGIMSHLACAGTADQPLNQQQIAAFDRCREGLDPAIPASLLNSAGMVNMPDQALNVVRPGIALYGSEPVADQALGLKPVMTLSGAVMQIREISAGTPISYDATFRARAAMRVAVVSLGYADGLPRDLSNRGHAFFNGYKLPIIGRICMDYTMLDVTDIPIKPGDCVEFWGNHILANDVAESIDSISYSLFTGVGARVQRMVEPGG